LFNLEENIEGACEEVPAGYKLQSVSDSDNPVDSSSCNDDEQAVVEFDLKKNLRKWSIEYSIPHIAVNSLMAIMRSAGHTELPKDARTLLCTPKISQKQTVKFFKHKIIDGILGN